MTRSIGIGVLGLGLHGTRYAKHIRGGDVAGAHLAAVWRRDRAKGIANAAELETRFFDDIDRLVEDDAVDAIVAAVPAGLHRAIAAKTAAAKKPLLCEKPLGRDVAEAEAIVEAFEATDTLLTVAQTLRFDPLVIALGAELTTIGELTGFCLEQRIEPRGLGWEDQPQDSGGGVVIQTGIHTLDALRVITRPDRVAIESAWMGRRVFRNVEDHALLTVTLQRPDSAPVSGHVASSKIGGSRHMRFAFYGSEGGLEADFIGRTLTAVKGRSQTRRTVAEVPTVARVATAFVEAIRGERRNPIPGREGVEAVRMVTEAYRVAQWTGGSNTNASSTTR